MGVECSAYGGGERCVQVFGGKRLRKRYHWGNSDVDGRIILKWIFRNLDKGVRTGLRWIRIETGGGHL
jgi:hypothetical protein